MKISNLVRRTNDYNNIVILLGGLSDCEELVEVTYRGMMGDYSMYLTPLRLLPVPEVLEVHVVASNDVRIVPELPTITKVLFP